MVTAVNPKTGERVELVNGQWVPAGQGGQSAGPKARPDWGQGAMELPNGAIVTRGPRGGLTILQAAGKGGTAGGVASGGATGEAKNRLAIMSGPAIQAEQDLDAIEQKHGNPLNTLTGGLAQTMMGAKDDGTLVDGAAKFIGGQTFQDYNQASKAFEASMLPIFSGAAVTTSEAQRMTRAALPQLGDSRITLSKKQRTRRMMLNGAATLQGKEAPFPDVPAWDFKSGAQAPQQRGRPVGWTRSLPTKQRAALQQYYGSKEPSGSEKNPFVPRNGVEFDHLPKGAWVLDDDGTVFQK